LRSGVQIQMSSPRQGHAGKMASPMSLSLDFLNPIKAVRRNDGSKQQCSCVVPTGWRADSRNHAVLVPCGRRIEEHGRKERGRHTDTEKKNKNKIRRRKGEKRCDARVARVRFEVWAVLVAGENKSCGLA
jgi:hypothetical protein